MKRQLLRLIILNWNWDDDLAYPTFVPRRDEKPERCSLPSDLTWIPAVKPEKIEEVDDGFRVKEGTSIDTFIAPTKVQLNDLLDTGSLPRLRRHYLSQIFGAVRKRFPNKNDIEILFLFHRKDGFDEGREIRDILTPILDSVNGADRWQIKAGFFGGASGVMYESRGFISPRYYNFRFKKREKVGWFDTNYRIQFLDIKHFCAVWEEYWYQTPLRLLDYRHLMNQMLIPEVGDTLKPKARKYTKNLLYHLHEQDDRQYKELEKESWDFSECVDLDEWLTAKNKKFPSHQAWIGDLKKFVAKEATDFSNMKKGFDELTESFYS